MHLLWQKIRYLCIAAIILGAAVTESAAEPVYVSQDHIDTLVHRAFYLFTESQDIAPTKFKQKQAIEGAKGIVAQLRRIASQSPNEKYILWKISEIEAQIFLEEQDLHREDSYNKLVELNSVIDRFNAELPKKRPNFRLLKSLSSQAQRLHPGKANELEQALSQRDYNVSKQLLHQLDTELTQRNIAQAEKILRYLYQHRGTMQITFAQFQKRLNTFLFLKNSSKAKEELRALFVDATRALQNQQIGKTRDLYRLFAAKVDALGNHMPTVVYEQQRDQLQQKITHSEDSLASVARSLLDRAGPATARAYVQNHLQPMGVSPRIISELDYELVAHASHSSPYKQAEEIVVNMPSEKSHPLPVDISELQRLQRRSEQNRMQQQQQVLASSYTPAARSRSHTYSGASTAAEAELLSEGSSSAPAASPAATTHATAHASIIGGMPLGGLFERRSERKNPQQEQTARSRHASAELTAELRPNQQKNNQDLALDNKPQSTANQQAAASSTPEQRFHLKMNQRAQQYLEYIYSMLEAGNTQMAYQQFSAMQEMFKRYLNPQAYSVLEHSVNRAVAHAE